jgi:hypothetical protein
MYELVVPPAASFFALLFRKRCLFVVNSRLFIAGSLAADLIRERNRRDNAIAAKLNRERERDGYP